MSYLDKPDHVTNQLVADLIDSYYPDLVECQVLIGVLMAHPSASNPEKPPLTRNGFPVNGSVRVVSYANRVLGHPDAVITLSGPAWTHFSKETRAAEVDKHLLRLEVVRDKEGVVKTDDALRPVLRLRRFDHEVSVSDTIIRRHGRHASEAMAIEELSLHYQTLLPGSTRKEDAPPDASKINVDGEEAA